MTFQGTLHDGNHKSTRNVREPNRESKGLHAREERGLGLIWKQREVFCLKTATIRDSDIQIFFPYLHILLAPAKKSSLFLLADLLGGNGGLLGKYIQTNRKRNKTTPHSITDAREMKLEIV